MNDITLIMDDIDKLNTDDYKKDEMLAKAIREKIFPAKGMKDGPCLAASFISCMGFLGKGLTSIPQPGSSRFKEFGDPFYKTYGNQIWNPQNTQTGKSGETIGEYKENLSKIISDNIPEDTGAVILCLDSESHYISAFKYHDRIWYVDALQGYGFNLYENALNGKSKQPADSEFMKQDFTVDVVVVDPETFNNASTQNWWQKGVDEVNNSENKILSSIAEQLEAIDFNIKDLESTSASSDSELEQKSPPLFKEKSLSFKERYQKQKEEINDKKAVDTILLEAKEELNNWR